MGKKKEGKKASRAAVPLLDADLKKISSSNENQVKTDTNFPRFLKDFDSLTIPEQENVISSIDKVEEMTWRMVYLTSSKGRNKRGINWEPTKNPKQFTCQNHHIATIRVTLKHRARVYRDEVFMVFLSLHPDHDSAYEESGGEDVSHIKLARKMP